MCVFPSRDDGPLPEGVELVDGSLRIQGAVGDQHAGLYECSFSYHHHQAALKFNITVKHHVVQPGRWDSSLKHFDEYITCIV